MRAAPHLLLALFGVTVFARTMTNEQAIDIVYWHNKARSEIASQSLCANMLEMEWDWMVANVAMDYTEACGAVLSGHNANRNSEYAALGGTGSLGENWAAGGAGCSDPGGGVCPESGVCGGVDQVACDCTSSCKHKSAIYERWYGSETVDPSDLGNTNCRTYAEGGGHCTQVTWQSSYLVGCGWKNCVGSPYNFYFVCNYSPAGNFNINSQPTVNGACISGPACSACPDTHPYCTTGENAGLCSKYETPATSGTGTGTTGGASGSVTSTAYVAITLDSTDAPAQAPVHTAIANLMGVPEDDISVEVRANGYDNAVIVVTITETGGEDAATAAAEQLRTMVTEDPNALGAEYTVTSASVESADPGEGATTETGETEDEDDEGGISGGAIAAIVIVVILIASVILLALVFFMYSGKKKLSNSSTTSSSSGSSSGSGST